MDDEVWLPARARALTHPSCLFPAATTSSITLPNYPRVSPRRWTAASGTHGTKSSPAWCPKSAAADAAAMKHSNACMSWQWSFATACGTGAPATAAHSTWAVSAAGGSSRVGKPPDSARPPGLGKLDPIQKVTCHIALVIVAYTRAVGIRTVGTLQHVEAQATPCLRRPRSTASIAGVQAAPVLKPLTAIRMQHSS